MAKYIYKHDHQTLQASVEKTYPQGKPALTVTFSLRQGDMDIPLARRSAPLNVLLEQASSALGNISTAEDTTFERSEDKSTITLGTKADAIDIELLVRRLESTFLGQLEFEKAPFRFRDFASKHSGGQSAGR